MTDIQLTKDTLFNGGLFLYQYINGYRFSVDALLLSWFSGLGKGVKTCADLGSGCGIIGLSLLYTQKAESVFGIEIQNTLYDLCIKNAALNSLNNKTEYINCSLADHKQFIKYEKKFTLVVSNPPFWSSEDGMLPFETQKKIAKHETEGTLSDFVKAAHLLLHPKKGRFCIIYPIERFNYLINTLHCYNLYAKKITPVYSVQNSGAKLLLVEARCGKEGKLDFTPPVYLKNKTGSDSSFIKKLYNNDF